MNKEKNNKNMRWFIASVVTMLIIYAASAAPISFFATYQTILGLNKANLSILVLAYFIGTVISLIMFGKVSNYLGRKKTILINISIIMLAMICFYFLNSYVMLITARFLSGLACGLASSCVGAYIFDTTPNGSSKLTSIATNSSIMFWLAVGVILSGLIFSWNNTMINLVYVILLILLILCAVLILLGPETVPYKPGVLKTIKPTVSLPIL